MFTLYPYQSRGCDSIRDAYIQGYRAPLYVLPTGGGKTVIFSDIAHKTSMRNKKVLILVHRIELLRQTSKALLVAGVQHGLINTKYTPNLRHSVQVASVQTLKNRLMKYDWKPDLIIIDEGHHANAGTWRKVCDFYSDALILGVTATPIRKDGKGLGVHCGGIFDHLIVGPQIKELIALGNLVQPVVYAPTEKIDLSDVSIERGDYVPKQIESKVNKPQITGNAVNHYRQLCPHEPCVVFCASIDHAKSVAAQFREAGFKFYAVDGTMKDEERDWILKGLGTGEVEGVVSCDLISEGTDIPAVACVILLRPTASLGLFLQQIGRGLRVCKGKKRCIILDHVGNVIEHGMPDDDREWTLDGEPRKKRVVKSYNIQRMKECEKCRLVHSPAPVCPGCGFDYNLNAPPEEVAGELQVVTEKHALAIKMARTKEVAEAKTLDELEAIGIKRGYKKNWAAYVYKLREQKINNLST